MTTYTEKIISKNLWAVKHADHQPCVLILEDDPFIAIDMEDSFLEAGFEVMGPYSRPSEAIAACLERTPDVATLDHHLMEGTSRQVAEMLDRQKVPVVMVTSESKMNLKRETFAKPCDMDALIDRTLELATA